MSRARYFWECSLATSLSFKVEVVQYFQRYFKLEKWREYANETTDDVIHSTKYYIEYINRALLANLQCRTLKLGTLIVLH